MRETTAKNLKQPTNNSNRHAVLAAVLSAAIDAMTEKPTMPTTIQDETPLACSKDAPNRSSEIRLDPPTKDNSNPKFCGT